MVWARICTAVAGMVGGTARGGVSVDTRVVAERFLVEPPPGT